MRKKGKRYKKSGFLISPFEAMSAHEHELIIRPTHVSLQAFVENRATATDWYNVTFRCFAAMEMAKLGGYDDNTIRQIREVYDVLNNIEKQSAEVDHKLWLATVEEIDDIRAVIEASDTLQLSLGRLNNYRATIAARDEMKKWL